MREVLKKQKLKLVPTLGNIFLLCPQHITFGVFGNYIFKGTLEECEAYLREKYANA